jgi:hypothetical protein
LNVKKLDAQATIATIARDGAEKEFLFLNAAQMSHQSQNTG